MNAQYDIYRGPRRRLHPGVYRLRLRRGLYRLLSPRTAVLISVIYWYLLEALRLPKDLASFTQLEYDFGMFCVVLATLAFLAAFHGIHVPLFRSRSHV